MRAQFTAACLALATLAPAAEAATVTSYMGQFGDGGYETGYFSGTDHNDDGMIDQSELESFYMVHNNWNGGPSAYYHTTDIVGGFLFQTLAGARAVVSGAAQFFYKEWFCGGWRQMPCDLYAYHNPGTPLFEMRYYISDFHYESPNVTYTSSVPLPAGAGLMAGGLAALAALRRRRRA